MKCLNEVQLEKYILGSSTITDEEKLHIMQCDRCKKKFLMLEEIYREFLNSGKNIFIEQQRLIELDNEQIISLSPITHSNSEEKILYRLAAQGDQKPGKFIVYPFSNEKEGVVGRIMQHKETDEVNIYLITENPEEVKGVKVKLNGSNLEALTDSQGIASFGIQRDFQCTGVQVISPLAEFELKPLQTKPSLVHEEHNYSLKNENHDEIFIEIDSSISQTSYQISIIKIRGEERKKELQVIAFTNQDRIFSQNTKQGITVFETEEPEKILKIHIF